MAHLRSNLWMVLGWAGGDLGVLSKTKIIQLLQENDEENVREIRYRFKIFVKWLSTNPMSADEKAKALEMFDFDQFSIEDLASTVRESGLYPSDKIIERMKELADEIQGELKKKEGQLEELKQEMKETLAVKEQEIIKLINEKKIQKREEALNRKNRFV